MAGAASPGGGAVPAVGYGAAAADCCDGSLPAAVVGPAPDATGTAPLFAPDVVAVAAASFAVVGGGAGVLGAPTAAATSSRPFPRLAPRPFFAVASTRSTACCGLSPRARRSATAPATCGAAIDVPASYAYWLALSWNQYVERIMSCGWLKFGSAPPAAAML